MGVVTINGTLSVTGGANFSGTSGASFGGPISVPSATAGGHALNRDTGDGRYAPLSHTHAYLTEAAGDLRYAPLSHTHAYLTEAAGDLRYAPLSHTHAYLTQAAGDLRYAPLSHTHAYLTQAAGDLRYAPLSHDHSGVYGNLASTNIWQENQYFSDRVGFGSYNGSYIVDWGGDIYYRALNGDHNFQTPSGNWATVNMGGYNIYSDQRHKLGLQKLNTAQSLTKIRRFEPNEYHLDFDPDRRRLGLVAQTLQEVEPDLVSDHDGNLMIDYTGVVVLLMAAVQDIDARLVRLEK